MGCGINKALWHRNCGCRESDWQTAVFYRALMWK